MTESIVQKRLAKYQIKTIEQEENALKEIAQEIILYGLSVAGLFEEAMFQGGTALRILYQLPRFSEDMDFILNEPSPQFTWKKYINSIEETCKEYGIVPTITDRSKTDNVIKKLFIKDDSFGKILNLNFKKPMNKKILIKLEIDVNPPLGSTKKIQYLDFPLDYAVVTQGMSSSFASKSHALLCRSYAKGRDWYDFLWYITQGTIPNFNLLSNAINQMGPWQGQGLNVTPNWYLNELSKKINLIDWNQAKADVERFLNERERLQLKLWHAEFFQQKIKKLGNIILGNL